MRTAVKLLIDVHFSKSEVVRVVLGNLNALFGAQYETFAPAEARRIARKLTYRSTPKDAVG